MPVAPAFNTAGAVTDAVAIPRASDLAEAALGLFSHAAKEEPDRAATSNITKINFFIRITPFLLFPKSIYYSLQIFYV